MTSEQRNRILFLRNRILFLKSKGCSLPEISERVQVSVNTIKSFLSRHRDDISTDYREENLDEESFLETVDNNTDENETEERDKCEFCGIPIFHIEGKRKKKFCSDKCRMSWWYRNRNNDNGESVYWFICEYCGTKFSVYGNKHRKYCSQDCFHKARVGGRNDK